MSRSSEVALAAALSLLVCAGALAPAQAQQQPSPTAASIRALQEKGKDAGEKGKAAPGTRDAAVSTLAPRTNKRPLLRCWQEGKLIYEGGGLTVPASAASAPIELRNGTAVGVQIFDLKSGMCLLDHSTD